MRRICLALALLLILGGVTTVRVASAGPEGDPDAARAAREKILAAEMRRRSADLVAYLQPDVDPATRRLAIRALGRIGDDGNGIGMLRDLLASASKELGPLYWAAGIARSKELTEPLTDALKRRLDAGDFENAAIAAKSLGWSGGDGLAGTLVPLLAHEHASIRAAALIGLGRARVDDKATLEAASKLADDGDAGVCAAAEFACWTMAGAYAPKAKKADKDWDGEAEIAARFLPHLGHYAPQRRMGGIRVLGILMPKACAADGPFAAVYELVLDPDERVVQDAVWRLFTKREGEAVDAALVVALQRTDPKTRAAAAKALGAHGSARAKSALAARWQQEQDARVREDLTVELARVGEEDYWKKLQKTKRAQDLVVREITDAQVLVLSKRPEAMAELFQYADPGASQRGVLHAATWLSVLAGVEEREGEIPYLDVWLTGFLDGGYAVPRDERHFVIAAAVGVVGTRKRHDLAPLLLKMLGRSWAGLPHNEITQTKLHLEVRSALMGAFAELAADEACKPEIAGAMKKAVAKHMHGDPSPWVRLAAREAGRELKLEDVPDVDEGQPTDWKGVPRAAHRNASVDPAGESEYLNEAEILQLADWITENDPRIVFETTAGTFTVGLNAEAAPVHCVSLLNAVRNGIYDDTRWHRVVPNFVIQGGDPHGHGGGGGGWHVPDEITPLPYVRGALGMPKSVKDDGGCQLFFMHTAYHPLNERYTCYGSVRSGMDTVDKIRVGDFITKATVVVRLR